MLSATKADRIDQSDIPHVALDFLKNNSLKYLKLTYFKTCVWNFSYSERLETLNSIC